VQIIIGFRPVCCIRKQSAPGHGQLQQQVDHGKACAAHHHRLPKATRTKRRKRHLHVCVEHTLAKLQASRAAVLRHQHCSSQPALSLLLSQPVSHLLHDTKRHTWQTDAQVFMSSLCRQQVKRIVTWGTHYACWQLLPGIRSLALAPMLRFTK
jgi:hypothetical protein